MLHSRRLDKKIKRLHERCLRIIYKNNLSTFHELLEFDNYPTYWRRDIKIPMELSSVDENSTF